MCPLRSHLWEAEPHMNNSVHVAVSPVPKVCAKTQDALGENDRVKACAEANTTPQ